MFLWVVKLNAKFVVEPKNRLTIGINIQKTTRRLINLDLYETHTPRQKITALAEEYNIPFSTARQIFAEDGYHQKPS